MGSKSKTEEKPVVKQTKPIIPFEDMISYAWDMTVKEMNNPGHDKKKPAEWRKVFYECYDLYSNISDKKRRLDQLPISICAKIALEVRNIVVIDFRSSTSEAHYETGYCLPAIYMDDKGIYSTEETEFDRILADLIVDVDDRKSKMFRNAICREAPCVHATGHKEAEKNLIPMGNGIFDRKCKILYPFSPDYIFLWKCPVRLNLSAPSPILIDPVTGTPWEFEAWLREIMSGVDEDVVFIKQVIASCLLPHISREKMVVFYNEAGSAGKGTLLALIRNLIPGSYLNADVDDISTDYVLAPLRYGKVAILGDENDVASFAKSSKVLKSLITGDGVNVNMKYKDRLSLEWSGTIIQCFNDLKCFSDKTGSFFRRFAMISFNKKFTDPDEIAVAGQKKIKAIKDDFIKSPNVLEYVVKSVLIDLPYFEDFIVTKNSLATKALLIDANSPVADFFEEYLEGDLAPHWDRVPARWLYEAYKAYHSRYGGNRSVLIKEKQFKQELKNYLSTKDSSWRYIEQTRLTKKVWDQVKTYTWTAENDFYLTIPRFDASSDPRFRGVLERKISIAQVKSA